MEPILKEKIGNVPFGVRGGSRGYGRGYSLEERQGMIP